MSHEVTRSYGTERGEELYTKDDELLGIFPSPEAADEYATRRSEEHGTGQQRQPRGPVADILSGRDAPTTDFATLAKAAEPALPSLESRIAQTERDLEGARSERERTGQAEVEALRRRRETLTPLIEERQQQLGKPMPPPPTPLELPAPPSKGLHAFLAPVQGEDPVNAIMKLTQGITLLAGGFTGLARGDATAALAGMKGALQGWHDGDKQRADRAFADWKANTDRLLEQQEDKHRVWREIFEDTRLTNDQQMEMFKLALEKSNLETAEVQTATKNSDEASKWLTTRLGRLDAIKEGRDKVVAMAAEKQRHDEMMAAEKQRQDETRRLQIAEAGRRAAEHDATLKEIRDNEARNRAAAAEARQAERESRPAHGKFYDTATGRPRQISEGQWKENNDRVNRGERPQFTPVSEQQVQLIERLSIAPKILDRLDVLIDKINGEAPGENITKGLINKLKQKAGISADIQEIMTLNLDNALENAAALSGGQPRIAILQMLRGEATPNLSMTAEVAHRTVDTTRTTIRNRLTSTTGDPDSYRKMSQDFISYGGGGGVMVPPASELRKRGWGVTTKEPPPKKD